MVAVTTYVGAFSGTFQYDDLFTILINPHLNGWNTFADHLDHMVRPVLYATFLIDRSLYGTSASGYHLLNLLLHLGSGMLVFLIVTRAVNEVTRHIPFWTALLFLIHPIQTETVTYISGRASGLMAPVVPTGALPVHQSIGGHKRSGDRQSCIRPPPFSVSCWSVASKEPAVTFPLALAAVGRGRTPARQVPRFVLRWCRTILPFWLIGIVVGVVAWQHPRYADLAQFSLRYPPILGQHAERTPRRHIRAVLVLSVHGSRISITIFLCSIPYSSGRCLSNSCCGAGLAMAAFVSVRRLPLFTFGIGWFVLQMIPTTVIPRNDLLSERNLYLASIGILLVVVVLGSGLTHWLTKVRQRPRLVRIGAGSLACSPGSGILRHDLPTERTLSGSGVTLVRHGREILRRRRGRTTTSAMPTCYETTGTVPSKNIASRPGWIPTTRLGRKIFATPISTRWGVSKQLCYSFPARNTACPYRSKLRGLLPAILHIQSHEQQLMPILKHAGDQTAPGFTRIPGFDACHVRIEEQLVGATEKDLPGAVHAGDVPRDRANHHGYGRHVQRLFCQLGQIRCC